MKKLLTLTFVLATSIVIIPSSSYAGALPNAVEAEAQIRVQVGPQRGRRWGQRRPRTVIRTRITRIGRYRYRETLRITYLPNGRTRTQVISRVRLGRVW